MVRIKVGNSTNVQSNRRAISSNGLIVSHNLPHPAPHKQEVQDNHRQIMLGQHHNLVSYT